MKRVILVAGVLLLLALTSCKAESKYYTFDEYIEVKKNREIMEIPPPNIEPNEDGDAFLISPIELEVDFDFSEFVVINIYAFENDGELSKFPLADKIYFLEDDDLDSKLQELFLSIQGNSAYGSSNYAVGDYAYSFIITVTDGSSVFDISLIKFENEISGKIQLISTNNDATYFSLKIKDDLSEIYDSVLLEYHNSK